MRPVTFLQTGAPSTFALMFLHVVSRVYGSDFYKGGAHVGGVNQRKTAFQQIFKKRDLGTISIRVCGHKILISIMRSWDTSRRVCADRTLYFKPKRDHFPTALCCFGEEIKLNIFIVRALLEKPALTGTIAQQGEYLTKQAVLRGK